MTRDTPRVSILLPVFNADRYLEVCLRSIARQTERRWECVIVDDGSRDQSLAIAEHWAKQDSRVCVIERPHEGLVASLNAGLRHCTAPVTARMDADDWMHRGRLAHQLAFLDRNPRLSAAGCHVRIFPRQGLREGRLAYETWINSIEHPSQIRREAFVECPIAHPSLMIRTAILERFGYRNTEWPEDYDLVLRLLAAGHEMASVPQRLLAWRDHADRLSRTDPIYAVSRFTDCKADHLCQSFLADSDRYVLWGYGHTGRALRQALARLGRTPSHIVELHPGRLGQTIHAAPVIEPAQLLHIARRPIVVSVAGAGPRTQIREALGALGFSEIEDFICAA